MLLLQELLQAFTAMLLLHALQLVFIAIKLWIFAVLCIAVLYKHECREVNSLSELELLGDRWV